jgi:metal-responsive CopG/Arc/MetJ family transcriptional regulator
MRTIIDIPEDLLNELDKRRAHEGISRAEWIRRAIKSHLRQTDRSKMPGKDAAFGLWRERHSDALDYEDTLRAEWERR